jgi:O-antigen ligase
MDADRVAASAAPETSVPQPALTAPFALFCVYTFVMVGRPQDYLAFLEPARPALSLTILTTLVTALAGFGDRAGWRTKEAKLYLAFFVILCLGIPASIYRRASFEFLILGYVTNVAYFLLFLVHVTSLERLKRIVLVIALATLAFNLVWIGGGGFRSGRYMGGGAMFDPNDTAFVEVSLMSFGLCVVLGRYGCLAKLLSLASVLLSLLLSLYSGSRGGAIALAVWVLLFLTVRVANVSKVRKILIVAAGSALAFVNADKINVERYMTIFSLEEDYNVSDEYGRTDIWKKGLAALADSPLTGVGADCFSEAIGMERQRLGGPGKRQTAHNSYVQVATESGVFGAAAFLLLVGGCVGNFNRVRRRRDLAGGEFATHATLCLVGFGGLVTAAFFLSQGYSTLFTLYFAVSASLRWISTEAAAAPAAREEGRVGGLRLEVPSMGPIGDRAGLSRVGVTP